MIPDRFFELLELTGAKWRGSKMGQSTRALYGTKTFVPAHLSVHKGGVARVEELARLCGDTQWDPLSRTSSRIRVRNPEIITYLQARDNLLS